LFFSLIRLTTAVRNTDRNINYKKCLSEQYNIRSRKQFRCSCKKDLIAAANEFCPIRLIHLIIINYNLDYITSVDNNIVHPFLFAHPLLFFVHPLFFLVRPLFFLAPLFFFVPPLFFLALLSFFIRPLFFLALFFFVFPLFFLALLFFFVRPLFFLAMLFFFVHLLFFACLFFIDPIFFFVPLPLQYAV
jgi:hypothetical protein